MSTVQTIFPFNESLSKSKIKVLANASIEEVLNNGNPLVVAEAIKAMEEFVETVKKDDRFKSYVLEEIAKHNKCFTSSSGTKIEEIETAVSYDYSNNPQWVELDQSIAKLDVKKKALETRLRTIPAGKLLVDEETGETLIGPAKSSKSTYKITLAK